MASRSNSHQQQSYPTLGYRNPRRAELFIRRRNYVASFLKSTRIAHGTVTSKALATIKVNIEWIGERMSPEEEETIQTQINRMEREIERNIEGIVKVKPEALTKKAVSRLGIDALRELSRRFNEIEEVRRFRIRFGLKVDEDSGLTPDFSENGREVPYEPEEKLCDCFEDVNSRHANPIGMKPVNRFPGNQYRLF